MFAVGQLFSDEWAAYYSVEHLPSVGQHRVVNHSLQFTDPATSVHTQHAKSYWNLVKTKFKRMKGVHENILPSYLDEFMWRERHEVPLPQLWQVCVAILLSSTPFRIPRCTICWSTSPTVFAFVFSTSFFKNHQLSKICQALQVNKWSRDTSQGGWEEFVAVVWLPDFVTRLVRQVRLIPVDMAVFGIA